MRRAEETRERIDRAAIVLFARQGVDGTSIRQIAKEAGISLGALYNHYSSKEKMVEAIFSKNWALVGHEFRRISNEHDSLDRRVLEMVRYVFEFFERDWELASLTFSQRHNALSQLHMDRNNPYLAMRIMVVTAMKRGEILRQDPDVATAMLMGAIVQVIDTKILGRIKTKLSLSATPVARACLGMLRAQGGPARTSAAE
jgi:AcrR family transcriptional regulator